MLEPPLFEARGLGKTYRQGDTEVAALKRVDFQVRAGEFVVVAGPSGCGKTTLLNLMGGLDEADRGQVLFAGQDLATRPESERTLMRRSQLGFVFQTFNLVPVLSAFENVEYGLWLVGVPKAERRRKVAEVLETVVHRRGILQPAPDNLRAHGVRQRADELQRLRFEIAAQIILQRIAVDHRDLRQRAVFFPHLLHQLIVLFQQCQGRAGLHEVLRQRAHARPDLNDRIAGLHVQLLHDPRRHVAVGHEILPHAPARLNAALG